MKTQNPFAELSGGRLLLAAFVIALSNFMVVLDTTIANVSVPHITGNLAVSSSQGTWVITSYAVAEAICVPLTRLKLILPLLTGNSILSVTNLLTIS